MKMRSGVPNGSTELVAGSGRGLAEVLFGAILNKLTSCTWPWPAYPLCPLPPKDTHPQKKVTENNCRNWRMRRTDGLTERSRGFLYGMLTQKGKRSNGSANTEPEDWRAVTDISAAQKGYKGGAARIANPAVTPLKISDRTTFSGPKIRPSISIKRGI